MNEKRGFDRFIAVLALIASVVAAYYAYYSYTQDYNQYKQPELAMSFYMIEGDKETDIDSIKADPNKVKHDKGSMEYELPLKVANNSEADANKLTMWIGPQSSDIYQLELPEGGCGWGHDERRQQRWYSRDYEHMSPLSQLKLRCFKIRVKEGTQEVKLSWLILASRTLPKEGSLILRF